MFEKVLYIEGSRDEENGNLRKAFSKLLEKELKGKMPRIIMGDGKNQTIDKFLTTPLKDREVRYLLIDLDEELSANKKTYINKLYCNSERKGIICNEENTFFMVQEAESWIISQPNILQQQGINIYGCKKNPMLITKPSLVLADLYLKSNKRYHKVRDFSKLLPLLDTNKLKDIFSEFRDLLKTLS